MAERYINAAKDGYVDILREATKRDLNTPDEDGMTATLWAAHNGNLEALRLIVGREGDVNKGDYQGMTALHHAAMRGHMNVVSYLVHWGCNVYALDNDLHSALDLAALYDRNEIIRFLDGHLAEKQAKNPKQVSKLREEAMRIAEKNIKRYEKLTETAAKRAEKDYKRRQMQIDQQLEHQNDTSGPDSKTKLGFFKTFTHRIKGLPNGTFDSPRKSSVYSDAVGMTYSGGRTGITKRIQMKRLDSLTPKSTGVMSEFKTSDFDDNGNRTLRSLNKGIVGSTSEVIYVAGEKGTHKGQVNLKRGDTNIYRAKSESELLDSGTDSYYGDEDEEEKNSGMFNRPGVGKLTFLSNNQFLNTLHSFDDSVIPSSPTEINGDTKRISAERDEVDGGNDITKRQPLPWDQDDLGNLDDDEEDRFANELSTVNMFLWSCGLASYLHIFSQEKIDMQVLIGMTDSEFKELGLELGPRKKLRDAISRRKAVLETPTRMTDTHL